MSDDNLFDEIFAELVKPLHPIRQMSQEIEDKKALLEQRKAAKDKIKEAKRLLKEQLDKLNEQLKELDGKEADEYQTDYEIHREIRDLENKISEEEHRRREEERLIELERRKNIAMAGFKTKIEELSPAWEKYPHDYQWEGAGTLALMGSGLL